MTGAAFAYAQARLQSRHGERPGPLDWRRVQGVEDVTHYLQVARRTRLGRWVEELHGDHDSDAVELALRRQFREYIDEVARWLPQPWRDNAKWLKRLPDLPALQHLLSGRDPLPWMSGDANLQSFVQGDSEQRRRALQESDCGPLVAAWERGEPLAGAWFRHWRDTWIKHGPQGIEQVADRVQRFLQASAGADDDSFEQRCAVLQTQLTVLFRRHSFQPAACYAHLALIALDLMRLRADLLRRIWFGAGGVPPG